MINSRNFRSDRDNSDCKKKLIKLWNLIPLFIRFIFISTIILYTLNLFFPFISLYLANIPFFTIFHLNLWRIFTTVLITTNIINIIFGFIFWIREATNLENSIGTIKYMLIFFLHTVFIQVIYCLFSGIISLIIQKKEYMAIKISLRGEVENGGLIPLIMCEITILCLSNPNSPMKFLFFPCEFKAKFYPLIIFALFTLLNNFNIDFELLIGIVYGLIYHYILKKKIQITDKFTSKIENNCCFKWMTKINGFISVKSEKNKLVFTISNLTNKSINDLSKKDVFKPFHGKGVVLGETLGESARNGYRGISENSMNQNISNSISLETLEDKIK